MKDISRRLKLIDKRIQALAIQIPTYEDFLSRWEEMDELSKSLLLFYAECPDLCGEVDRHEKAIFEYLHRMGLVQNHYEVSDIVKEMEET